MKRVRKRTRKQTFSIFHITDTDIVHYACQNTDTDTEMTHITCFCRDTDMYLYFVSVIRGHLRNLRHLYIETPCFRLPNLLPLAKRQIQIDIKASTVVPNKSTSLARRA